MKTLNRFILPVRTLLRFHKELQCWIVPARHKITPIADHAKLGAFLRSVRIESGISQRDLAKRLNLPQSFISKLERGERQLQVLELIALCKIFQVEPTLFLKSFMDLPSGFDPKIERVARQSKQSEM